jgi:archaellum component FlaG (FlaF/FlaG flagellin family)
MVTLLEDEQKKKRINKGFIVAIIIAVLIIGGIIGLLARKPSMDEQKAKLLEGAYKEGSPEFAELTKDIIIANDQDKTVESPMATGTISMFISGNVRNKGSKKITLLEVNVAVVTQFKKVLQEKRVLVVPVQKQDNLEPGQTIPLTLTLDNFSKEDDRADIRWKVTAIKAE